MDSSQQLLFLAFGLIAGFGFGHVHAWRLARKLELNHVPLWKWDRPYDASATPDNVVPLRGQSNRS